MPFITAPLPSPRSASFRTSSFFGSANASCRRPRPVRHALISMQTPSPTDEPTQPYKVGLCIAGAVTGGAYSAGVIDFLLEALTAWEQEKNAPSPDPSVPEWDVAITEIIGTSSGGINSALTVHALNTDHKPLPRDYQLSSGIPDSNSLFQLWASEATYDKVFTTTDLDSQPPFKKVVASFMDANFMKNTVPKLLSPSVILDTVPKWAQTLYLSLTATNIRGVPYAVKNFIDKPDGSSKYDMRKYADYSEFRVAVDPSTIPDSEKHRVVDLSVERTDETWKPVVDCARGTAAFPVGFPSVKVRTPRSDYEGRFEGSPDWPVDVATVEEEEEEEIYEYAALDGGVCNNEPFGILIDNMEHRNDRELAVEPDLAWGSVILIDPFPSTQSDPQTVQDNIPVTDVIQSLFMATRGEASFKEDEIKAALEVDVMDKFMIAPKAIIDPSVSRELATAPFGNFAGVLDPTIPLHDFVLGRANCKYFLENVFVIKRDDALQNDIFKHHLEDIEGECIPIIPVVGSAAEPLPPPIWPKFNYLQRKAVVANVMGAIEERMKKVLQAYIQNLSIIEDWDKLTLLEKLRQLAIVAALRLIEPRLRERLMSMVEEAVQTAMDNYQ